MSLLKKLQLVENINSLIQRKATGTPKQFAKKLCVCESMVYNYINELKEIGVPINYSKRFQSYYYTEEVNSLFDFIFTDKLNIKNVNTFLERQTLI